MPNIVNTVKKNMEKTMLPRSTKITTSVISFITIAEEKETDYFPIDLICQI
jgi:hypothetical protein